MPYRSLKDAVKDLERNGHLVRVIEEVDPYLQMAAIHRRVNQKNGPAIYFEKIKNCFFPAVSNLYGTLERAEFLFRYNIRRVEALIELKAHPEYLLQKPWKYIKAIPAAYHALPLPSLYKPILSGQTSISQLPLIQAWPKDGGPFITLPQVYSEDPSHPSLFSSNLGMYRVQMQGNHYKKDSQIGLHYQIQRGIGVHHGKALDANQSLPISIFVGGPPAHALAAVMPLPEGLPEIAFGGSLAGRNFRYIRKGPYLLSADADFCIIGKIQKELLPEGPFGDHLGYYALKHNFPVLQVKAVFHKRGAIWPFTVVGRPPQEDSIFGAIIHKLTAPMVPVSIPGLKAMEAVDACGVHPLLLAIGRESYTPYDRRRPAELITIANAILGFGQASLAKYLFIAAGEDDLKLKVTDTRLFLKHILERVNWKRDLHFQTCTTMDTLDYSGDSLNQGSRVVIAALGQAIRKLGGKVPVSLNLARGFRNAFLPLTGVLLISGPKFQNYSQAQKEIKRLILSLKQSKINANYFPLLVIVDDSLFASESLHNFVWCCFTRSDPARDIYGVDHFIENKHWGCTGTLIIDARSKRHHAPPLLEDPKVERSVDALGVAGKSLHGII